MFLGDLVGKEYSRIFDNKAASTDKVWEIIKIKLWAVMWFFSVTGFQRKSFVDLSGDKRCEVVF